MPIATKKRAESGKPQATPAPLVVSYAILKADEPGDLYHLTKITIQGDRVLRVEKETATLRIIVAEQISHHLAMNR